MISPIYFDFEGFADQPPSMVGVLDNGQFRQIVLDPKLEPAGRNKGLPLQDIRAFGAALVERAAAERRPLAAYSTHEESVLREYAGVDIRELTINVRKLAKRWHRRTYPERPLAEWSLRNFLMCIGYPLPAHLGIQRTTHRLRGVLEGLEHRGGDYSALTPVQKAKWTKLLDHNYHDCFGMAALHAHIGDNPVP